MDFHKLLQKQIKKYLTTDCTESPSFQAFIQSVNDSYLAFERDKGIMDHTFQESEKEYNEVNAQLKKEIEFKQLAANNLYKSINKDDLDYDINFAHNDDLLYVSEYLRAQIEKRKKTEMALLENMKELEDYKFALDQSAIMAVTDENGIIRTVNDKFCEISQFSREELLGSTHKIINSNFHSKAFFKELWKTISTGNIWRGLIKNKKKNGEYYWEDTTIVPFLDAKKKPFQYLAVRFDVTEIKNAEDKIIKAKELAEQSEERTQIIMNSALNAIVTVDDKGKITFWNDQAEFVFGWKKEESLGKMFTDFMVPARNKALWDSSINQYLNEGHNDYLNKQVELFGVNKAGDEFLAEITITPITQSGETFFCAFLQDISKRKEAENQLYQTAELLKTLLANLQSGVLVEDKDQNILFSNQLFWDLKKKPISPDSMEGTDFSKAFEKGKYLFKDSESFVPRVNEILRLRQAVISELMETIDNRFLERDFIPIIIDKEYKGHLWKYTDVTQRMQHQKLLEQSENRSKRIMDASLNAIVTIDVKGRITFWNERAETIFGWNKAEVLGIELSKIIIPHQHVDAHNKGMKHYLNTGEGPVLNKYLELTALNRNGDEFPIEMSIIPIKENNELFFSSFIQDISEKKAAEHIRKIQQEKYQNIIANMNLGLLEVDNNEIIQYANQSFATISGYEIKELLGKNASEFFVFGENFDTVKSKNELRKQGVSDIYQLPIKNKRGELRWWAISGAPNYDDKGNLVGSIGIHLDITEQKQLEIDLEIEKSNALVSSKAKEIFLANMSHEIRTPLNAIIGFLRELDKQELSGLQRKYIDNSTIASKHLLAIINNILDISKIEAGEMSLENKDFVFEKSISNVATVLQPMLDHKGLDLDIVISNKIEKVLKGDTLRLEQILFNLIGNAIKFTNKGGICINCEVVEDTTVSQELQISVTDTGIGMESSFISTIFNKFSQEDKEITRKYGGTGLGLSITKELINLMNGRIEINSKKNIGTTIHIYLNYPKGSNQYLEDINIDKPITRIDNISILMVEDNYLNRMVAQNSLQYYNCKVTEAKNGLEAIEILKKRKFDVILMDIQMPEMGGIEATEIIRNELNISTPIIALTANAFKTEIDKCRKAGMDDYVTKPFDENILIETIAKHTVNKNAFIPKSVLSQASLTDKLYNLTSLQNLSRGNNEFVVKMISIFIEQTNETIEKISLAILKDDFAEVSRLIHKIKPSVESLGISTIIYEIKLLEKISKETTNKEKISDLFNTIKEILVQTVIELQDNELNQ
jgi:PAS domain S-box-containing protein